MNGVGAGLVGIAIPVGIIWLKLGIAFTRMAIRKGINTKLALIGAFPLWALPFGLWLMIRSDAPPVTEDETPDGMADPSVAEVPARGGTVGLVSGAVGPVSE